VTRLLVLGAGPAGLGAAFKVRQLDRASVTIIEQNQAVGGNAGSFTLGEQRVDFGSHRLHPACDPQILADIQGMLGEDLLDRPRHGRIRLRGRWIHFPLKPADLAMRLDRGFAAGALRDMIVRLRPGRSDDGDSFAKVLERSLGPTICRSFYFPYAEKIWGLSPDEISPVQAHRRVSANSFGKLLQKVFGSMVGGSRDPYKGRFFYPRSGYGSISEKYAERLLGLGGELVTGWTVTRLQAPSGSTPHWVAHAERGGEARSFEADWVWSTIPVTVLARVLEPAPPDDILQAARSLEFRSMLLVYLELPVERFTEFDAHYFPSSDTRITRLSEPKNYADSDSPVGSTVLCAELPCGVHDPVWSEEDSALAALVTEDLRRSGLAVPAAPTRVEVRRLPKAYPIYRCGFEKHFDALDDWVGGVPKLLSFGRQGLFAHDNTHHALAMAYAAAESFEGGELDEALWASHRESFTTHVVED
jgi:protoporphyrinogen oxidase